MRTVTLSLAMIFMVSASAHELDGERTLSQPSADQIAKAKDIPQTVIVRVSKADPKKVELVFLKDKVPAGKKLKNLKFEQMAMNSEKVGIAYSSRNELDATSSTSSWSFGYAQGPYGGSAGYVRGPYGGSAGYYRGPYGGSAGYVQGPYGGTVGYARGPYGGGVAYANSGGCGGCSYGNSCYGGGGCGYSTCGGGCGGGYNPCYGGGGCGGGCGDVCVQPYYPTINYGGYAYGYSPYYSYSDTTYTYAYSGWGY